jgi:bifunctional non-homologous end joining protein LigD
MAEKRAASKSTKRAASKKSLGTAADVVDEQLARYRSMRDFRVTAEPSGASSKSKSNQVGLPFCVQKHAASHLHYDFRLGWNGVLKSWAVAKGPSYVTADKRLAVQVEDHPMEYGGFEGIIPAGQYGGGSVMVWDQGTWEPQAGHTDIDAGLRDGSLKFVLHGTKLKGKWALIRMGGKWAKEKKPNWLLIKEHDDFERRANETPLTEAEPDSVVTGRSIEEIARHEDHVWNSKDTRSGNKAWFRKESREAQPLAAKKKSFDKELGDLPKEDLPDFLSPQLATMAEVPPSNDGWLHELKLDGYRVQARKNGRQVKLLTRTGLDWTARMRSIANEIARLAIDSVTLDGEVVVVAANGTTSFADLQASMQEGAKHDLTYFAFDLLHIDGRSPRGLSLKKRKELLSKVLTGAKEDTLRFSEHIERGGAELLREACRLKAEGIISKLATGKYVGGRSHDWLKMKCLHEQEFVVGGYTLPTNEIRGVGALLLGYYKGDKLIYAGRTGTGFTQKTHRMLRDKFADLARETTPFESVPADAKKGAHWVKPEVVAQVRFSTWTADELVRQAAFLGVREDKTAKEVVREDCEISLRPRRTRSKSAAPRSRTDESARPKRAKDAGPISVEHAPVRLTHPDKILDAESGLTKQMLADYYWEVANHLLPYIADRPVSLVRCPEGVGKACFFQKHANATLPKNIQSVDVPNRKTGEIEAYVTIDTPEALAGLAQLGVMELHPWGSRNDALEHPDRLVFDLDPDEGLAWAEVTKAAEEVRMRLKKLGLESFLKTTGGKGLHVVAPIEPKYGWSDVKDFARKVVVEMERVSPDCYLTKMTKSARVGKIFLDYLRNEREATSVAAYSPRARAGMAVSMPLSWAELKSKTRPVFRVSDFAEWRARLKKDPWGKMGDLKQEIRL